MPFWYLTEKYSSVLDQEIECPHCNHIDQTWRYTIWFTPPLTDTGPSSVFRNIKFKRLQCAKQLLHERGNQITRFTCHVCGKEFEL